MDDELTRFDGPADDAWPTRRMASTVAGGIVVGAAGIGALLLTGLVQGSLQGAVVGSLSTIVGIAAGSRFGWHAPTREHPQQAAPPASRLAA